MCLVTLNMTDVVCRKPNCESIALIAVPSEILYKSGIVTPEEKARQTIDRLLGLCDWAVQDKTHLNLAAATGIAVREVATKKGEAD